MNSHVKTLVSAAEVRRELRARATPQRAAVTARFFKTGPGEYGEGDVFIGVSVPDQRIVARAATAVPLEALDTLLQSKVHEERLTALLVLVARFTRTRDAALRERIATLYLRRLEFVNNWDLVDSSAAPIVGGWLEDRDRGLLDELAGSTHLWSRRVAMIATYHFIHQGEADDALRIAARLINDEHDLMHKAVGWMLREVGKRVGLAPLRRFLQRHAATMPRTALRYSLEKLPPAERKKWMSAGARDAKTSPTERRR